MSRSSLSPAVFRSISIPDGYSRGHRHVVEPELTIGDDTAGDPIVFTPEHRPEVEDKWSRLADALEAVSSHALVKKHGFAPCNLVTNVDSDHPVAMGFEVLAVLLAACQAARELADLAGKAEVCKVLGWTDPAPEFLKAFGADNLFRSAGAIQARVSEIRTEREAASRKADIKPRLTIPGRQSKAPAPRLTLPPVPTEAPESSDWLGRISTAHGLAYSCTCGCGVTVLETVAQVPPFEVMRDRQGSRVSAKDMWKHAFAPRCIRTWGRGFSLIETRNSAFKAEQEATARRVQPRTPTPTNPAARRVSRIGKTERERMKKLVKAGKMSQEEYTQRTGYHC